MRDDFIRAIGADPYDMTLRKVYADWLDEHGVDSDAEEAVVQRAWTVEKQEAIKWLTDFSTTVLEMEFDDLMMAAKTYISEGKYCRLKFDMPDEAYDQNDKLWDCISLVLGTEFTDDQRQLFFRCAC